MKIYPPLVLVLCASILSGCSLLKFKTKNPHNRLNDVNALSQSGKKSEDSAIKMEASAIKKEFSNSTFYTSKYTAFLKADGSALVKKGYGIIGQYTWTASIGGLCIGKACYDIEVKDSNILIDSGRRSVHYKKGDTENLDAQYADVERKEAKEKAEEQAAQARAQAEEARCMASPQCRAKKEQEERHHKEASCSRYYAGYVGTAHGKTFFFLSLDSPFVVRYVNTKQGKVTIEWTRSNGGVNQGDLKEVDCETLSNSS